MRTLVKKSSQREKGETMKERNKYSIVVVLLLATLISSSINAILNLLLTLE
jgi:hypothetical protein